MKVNQNHRAAAEALARRPYRIGVRPDETTDGTPAFFAWVQELDGCVGCGTTQEEALDDAARALVDYIESMLDDGLAVPPPFEDLPISYSVGPQDQTTSSFVQTEEKSVVPETEKPYAVAQAMA